MVREDSSSSQEIGIGKEGGVTKVIAALQIADDKNAAAAEEETKARGGSSEAPAADTIEHGASTANLDESIDETIQDVIERAAKERQQRPTTPQRIPREHRLFSDINCPRVSHSRSLTDNFSCFYMQSLIMRHHACAEGEESQQVKPKRERSAKKSKKKNSLNNALDETTPYTYSFVEKALPKEFSNPDLYPVIFPT